VHNDVLTVSGETRSASERSEEGYAVRERQYGKLVGRSRSLKQGKLGSDSAFLRQKRAELLEVPWFVRSCQCASLAGRLCG
jgi:hypothetical protein